MAQDKDVNFSVGAEGSAVDAEFERLAQASMTFGQRMQSNVREAGNRMQAAFKENTDKMNAGFDGLKGKIEALRGQLAAVAAVAVAGRWLKGAADDSNALTQESVKLGRQLGISATEARLLSMSLGDVRLSTEQFVGAHNRLQQTLSTNEKAFQSLGVATRDGNGNFRNSMDIMRDTNAALARFKEGTDRNVEGMKIYGKQWSEVMNIVNLTPEAMEKAREKAQALGLEVGQEGVAASEAYIDAMDDVSDVLSGMKNAIGNAVMPVLTQLGNWFYSIGPAAVTVVRGAIGGLVSVFWGLRLVVEVVIQEIMRNFERMGARISQILSVTMRVIQGDWSGAKAAWDKGQAELEAINQKRFDNIAQKAEDTRQKIWNAFAQQTPLPEPEGGATSTGGSSEKQKTVNRSSEWEARLQDMRNAFAQEQLQQGTAYEFSKAAERDYWKNILDTVKMSQEERRAVLGKYIALEQELQKSAFDQHIADMQQDLAQAAAGGTERIRIAAEIAAEIGKQYGLESQQYQQSLAAVQQAARDHQAQMAQIEQMAQDRRRTYQLAQLDLERLNLDQQLAMGDISNQQRLTQLMILKEQEYQIELHAAMDRAALLENDAIAYQQAMDRVLEIKRQHELDKKTIENEMAKQQKADYDEMFAPITNAFNKSITGMIQGTQTLRDVTRNMLLNIASEYAAMGVRILMNWVANETRKTLATAAGASTRTGIETAAAAQSTALSGSSTLVSIMNDAYEAMAGAYAAIAGIPYVGPFLAPAVAAGAFTVVAGLAGSVASAQGGYDIPGGVNPLTQLHEREMVLPSQHADVIRALSERGDAGGGNLPPIVLKGADANGFFIANKKELVKAINSAGRDFMK
ncbi:hypothetical protein IHQ56_02760 [Methylobacillus flagellatus]|uniref:hypothetical protein n=1 Tax=Methylobacillus flagellatus TaxID=405 RepID=UPI002853E904|nr:hypothetical protein [Methylobacillus flagellatus]MDR5170731.1 hypothetical protein [Methylobacillus flagellatus]